VKRARLGPAFIAATLAFSAAAAAAEDEFPFRRAAYSYRTLSQLEGTGFDAVLVPIPTMRWEKAKAWMEQTLVQRCLELSALGIKAIAGPYYCVPPSPDVGNYSRAVGQNRGPETVVPSPVDETWWNYFVDQFGVFIANLSVHYPIWGIVWDSERYIDGRYFEYADYSYDEAAVQEFARDTGRSIPYVPPDQRYGWLQEHGLVEEFHAWQEEKLYRMARRTAEKIHAINPNISLGLLGMQDSWFHWAILEAFNCSTAPVTAWYEGTYQGYKKIHPWPSPAEMRELWKEHKLYGLFLPGLWGLAPGYGHAGDPWSVLIEMEAATRDNGAFWVYEWNYNSSDFPFQTRGKTYQVFNSFIFFNASSPNPLPSFDLHPGVQAMPYLGPAGNASVVLHPYVDVVPSDFTILCDSGLWYVGQNMTVTRLGLNPTLESAEIPCIVSDLSQEDLLRTEVWAMIQELDNLAKLYRSILAGDLPGAENLLSKALEDFRAGRHLQARSLLLENRGSFYGKLLADIWPMAQEGLASPRTSKVPIAVLRSVSDAKRMFEDGKAREGEAYLFAACRQWSAAVPEPLRILFLAALVILVCRPRTYGHAC